MIISDDGISVFMLVVCGRSSGARAPDDGHVSDDFRAHLTAQGFLLVADSDARSVVSEAISRGGHQSRRMDRRGRNIVAFLRRHRGKVHRFEIEGKSVSIEGYSARDAKKLAADLLDLSRPRGKPGRSVGTGTDRQS